MIDYIKRWFECVYYLGFRRGRRYWKIQNQIINDPTLGDNIRMKFLRQSKECRTQGKKSEAELLECFAMKPGVDYELFKDIKETIIDGIDVS